MEKINPENLMELGVAIEKANVAAKIYYAKKADNQLAAKDAEIERLRQKTCQAYQVIGCLCLLDNPELPNEKEAERALDYFADDKLFDEDFLPFNPFDKSNV